MGKTKDIRMAVENELRFDPLVDPADITVKNVGGEVAAGRLPGVPTQSAPRGWPGPV